MLLPPKKYLAQGDLLANYKVPHIPGLVDEDFTEYGLLVAHSCDLESDYSLVATTWREETFRKLFEGVELGNIRSGRVLQFFPITDAGRGLSLIVDFHHVATWPTTAIASWHKEASFDADETERLQAALVHDFALRQVTREKHLQEYEGRTIQRIRSVKHEGDQKMVTVTVEDDDSFQLWLHARP